MQIYDSMGLRLIMDFGRKLDPTKNDIVIQENEQAIMIIDYLYLAQERFVRVAVMMSDPEEQDIISKRIKVGAKGDYENSTRHTIYATPSEIVKNAFNL